MYIYKITTLLVYSIKVVQVGNVHIVLSEGQCHRHVKGLSNVAFWRGFVTRITLTTYQSSLYSKALESKVKFFIQ